MSRKDLVEDIYPLSPTQRGLLFHALYAPRSGQYIEQLSCTLRGGLDLEAFHRAWERVVQRHPALRTVFLWEKRDEPAQLVYRRVRLPWREEDWREGNAAERFADLCRHEQQAGFDLSRPPLMRFALLRVEDQAWRFLWTHHHLLLDGWSLPLVLQEVFRAYGALARGEEPVLPPVQPYGAFLDWLARQDLSVAERYWRSALAGFHAATPLGLERPAAGTGFEETRAELEEEAAARLHGFARAHRLTLGTLIQGAWAALLARYAGEEDVLFGLTLSGRPADLPGVESIVGLFINTLPVRVTVPPEAPLVPWLAARQARQIELQRFSFTPLADVQRWSAVPRGTPLFETLLVIENYPVSSSSPAWSGGSGAEVAVEDVRAAERTHYPITVAAFPGRALQLLISWDRSRLEGGAVQRLLGHLATLLNGMAAADRLGDLPLLTEAEQSQLREWNPPEVAWPGEAPIHEIFAVRARQTPDAVAVIHGAERVTYGELARRAARVARALRAAGIGPEDRVGILMARSPKAVAAILGTLQAGAAYVPLDPAYGSARLSLLMESAAPRVVLTESGLDLPDEDTAAEDFPSVPPEALAYVIFTSGSTGVPKGVMVSHRSLTNAWFAWRQAHRLPDEATVHLQTASLAFDVFTGDLVRALASGGRLVICPRETLASPSQLLDLICAEGVEAADLVPAVVRPLVELLEETGGDLGGLRLLVVGSDVWYGRELDRLRRLRGMRTRILSAYGLTEAAVDSAYFEPGEGEVMADAPVPLGLPFANTRLYVVGRDLRAVPVGVAGELVIGGRGLARGYLGQPDLTAERFVPDPFADGEPGARLYCTGDRVRRRPDGVLELLGRVDQQVKIRGYRVEPGEVEAALREHPEVAQCAVAARREGAESRLLAWIVPRSGEISTSDLRQFLSGRLPDFFVPAAFAILPELPLSPNGKIDRQALLALEPARPAPTTAVPRDEVEEKLARIWAEVLKVERVGIHDNFFDLGGDSILSIQIVSRAHRAGLRITPRQIFDSPTIAGLAAAAKEKPDPVPQLVSDSGPLPLTPIQRWFFAQSFADPHHWNQALLLESAQPLDPARIDTAVRKLAARHDALRLRFNLGETGWSQRVEPSTGPGFFAFVDLSTTCRREELERVAAALQASLHLEMGPLCRFVLLRPDRLLAIVHHLAVDGISWGVLLHALEALYRGEEPLPASTPFAAWAKGLKAQEVRSEVPAFPVDSPDAGLEANVAATARSLSVELDADETRTLLQEVHRCARARIDEVLLAALALAFRRWTGTGCLVDLEGHGREESLVPGADLSRTVGWFTSISPVELSGDGGPTAVLRKVKERLRSLPRHGVATGAGILFNYLGQVDGTLPASSFRLASESPGPLVSPRSRRSHVLEINALTSGGRLRLDWTWSTALHHRETVERFANAFLEALRELIALALTSGDRVMVASDFPLARLDSAALERIAAGSEVEDIYPLSSMQEGMLFHSLLAPHAGMYVEHLAFTVEGPVDLTAFRAAWEAALDWHAALRSDFVWEGLAEPLQVVRRGVKLPWRELDWSGLALDEQARRRAELIEEDRRQGLDLTRAPLMRLTAIRLGNDIHGFIWCHHHLLLDGWSLPLLLGDVFRGYRGLPAGEAPRPYRDYIAWLRSQDLSFEPSFWHEALRGLSGPTPLGIDRTRLAEGEPDLAARRVRLSAESTAALQDFARRHRLTLNTLLQAAWAALLGRYSGEEDVLYGCTVSGRPPELAGAEEMIGLFINTLPVRVRLSAAQPLAVWLAELQSRLLDLRRHEHAPLVEIQRWTGWPKGSPLFESVFVFENYPGGEASGGPAGEIRIREVFSAEGTNYALTLAAAPAAAGNRMSLGASYDRRRFDEPAAARLLGHLETLLNGMTVDPGRPVGELPLLSAAERAALVLEWNDTAADLGPDICAHRLFEEQARLRPVAPAIEMGDRVLTYRELDEMAGSVAARLRTQGVRPGSRVALRAGRSPETIAGLLGILKAGGAFVPLDPLYPEERLAFMLEDSGAEVVLGEDLSELSLASAPPVETSPDDLAYVIYTSGSTGRPKGVAVAHRGLINLVRYQVRLFGLGPGDRSLQFSSLSFDASVWEIFPALCLGATLVLAPAGMLPGPALTGLLRDKAVTFATLAPSTLAAMPSADLPALRAIVAAAEALPPKVVERWGRERRLFNGYGPTEATVCSNLALCEPGEGQPPLGRPIPNCRVYLLDFLGRLALLGAPGEIAIGGVGLAHGYLGRPHLTAERFVPDPFGPPGARLYRTGDLGRQRPDGAFDFLGRIDHQLKVRGHRVEGGEVEAALALHPEVREAAVTLWRRTADDQRLVAHAALRSEVPAAELAAFLRERLPAYMVPAHIAVLPELPRLPNGKLDRRSLPAPNARSSAPQSPMPRTPLEEEIAGVWREVLGVERVSTEDNFFDLGGHSLLVVRVHGRLRALGHELEVVDLFHHPTVAALAAHLGQDRKESRTVRRRPRPPQTDAPAGSIAPDIAIVGLACRFPGAPGPDAFWRNLRDGVESISFFSEEELRAAGVHPSLIADPSYVPAKAVLDGVDRFDAAFFNITPRDAERMDPQHRVFLEICWEALESAACDPSRYPGAIGVFAGETLSTYLFHLASDPRIGAAAGGMQTMIGLDREFLTTTASYKLGLRGPSLTLQTACSTSLVAVCVACQSLRSGESDMALAGGVSIRVPAKSGYLYQDGSVNSPDGHCRAFDAEARGTVGGDGAGVVLLKRLEDALRDGDPVRAVIRGWALNNDGSGKVGYTAPSVEGQAEAIAAAQDMAGVDPETITFVEGHGTATPLGDPIEVAALTKVFRESTGRRGFCALGAVKSNFGHLDAAAGVAGLIKAVLALEHREIPPTVHFQRPNPETKLETSPFFVNATVIPWQPEGPRRAGVSSFGLGGTNAHVVLEEAPEAPAPQAAAEARTWQIFPVSARSAGALDAASANLARWMEAHPEAEAAGVAWTLQTGRRAFRHRRAVVSRDLAGAAAALASPGAALDAGEGGASVAFLFSGQGSQHAGMGRGLYAAAPVFRRELDRCAEILRPHLGLDLREALADGERLRRTALAQPALFAFEHALARQWMEWGVQPAAMLGHSVGEYLAACLAGVMTLEDALGLVALRGRLMGGLPPGAMLAVPLPEMEVLPLLGEGLSLAAVNEPARCVVSGPTEAVAALEAALAARSDRGVAGRRLHTSHAFHSAMMEPVLDRFANEVAKVELSAPRLPYLSNVTGSWITAAEATDPGYWARHLRQTVRFADGVAELLRPPGRVLLEVGPGSALAAMVQRQAAPGVEVVASCRRPDEEAADDAVLLGAAGRLWMAGVDLDWHRLYGGAGRRRLPLPTYPFERRRYWVDRGVDTPAGTDALAARPGRSHLAADIADWFHVPTWRRWDREPRPADAARAAGPWLVLADPGGLGDRLADRLREAGARVTVAPWRTADLDTLLAEAAPRRIIHLGSLDPVTLPGGDPWEGLEASFFSLLRLAQALGRRSGPVELVAVTSGAFEVTGGEELKPLQAAVAGVCKTLPREVEGISCRVVDAGDPARLDRLVAELAGEAPPMPPMPPMPPITAVRGPYVWVQEFAPVRLPAPEASAAPSRLRQEGVYLLTGGLGGIALATAGRLARDWRARLVLVGRAPLSESPQDERAARRLAAVRELQSLGAEVLVLAADVADLEAMREVRERALARFGRIDGVFHSAGAAAGGLLHGRSREAAARVLAPKVLGALVLDELFAEPGGAPLDFLVLFSSMASLVAGVGQGDYVAANAFLDSFAQARNARGAFTVAVNWDTWQDVGMAVNALNALDTAMLGDLRRRPEESLREALPVAAGVEALIRLLAGPWAQVAVSRRHVQTWIEETHAARFGDELRARQAEAVQARPALASAYVEPRTARERRVAAIWSELLGVDPVGALDDFFKLGGDSLIGIQVIARLRQAFGVELPLRTMLEASTVARLAELVGEPEAPAAPECPREPQGSGRLVTIQAGNGQPGKISPLFLVHPAGGHVLGYRPLAERLGADRPVYGLEARGTQPGETPCETIEEMAAEHVAALTALRPRGPYILGGASMGGTVAWEMARQLRARGERVDLVALFDTPGPGQMPGELKDDIEIILAYLGGARLGLSEDDLRRLPPEERLPRALERAAAAGLLPPGVDLERAASFVELFRVHVQAMQSYRPGSYAGRVAFFRAAERRPLDPLYPEVGWIGLAEQGAEVHVVPGDHGTMYLPPHVDTLASRLRRCLEDRE